MKAFFSSTCDLNSDDGAMGWLSGALRRLLCGKLYHHAFREVEEEAPRVADKLKAEQRKPAPGLVARLMGLESMPVHPYTPPPPAVTMGRSRSTSSLDSWPVFPSPERRSRGSPQIRPSSSFREAPTFLRQENEDFLLLSFIPDDKGDFFEPIGEKSKTDTQELRRCKRIEEERNVQKRRELLEREWSDGNSSNHPKTNNGCERLRSRSKLDDAAKPLRQRERIERPKIAKRRSVHAQSKIELECSSENSSPNSVLDNPFDVDRKYSINSHSPTSEDKKLMPRNSRRKLSSELECLINTSSSRNQVSHLAEDAENRSPGQENNVSRKKQESGHQFLDLWRHICRLTDEDVRNSNWAASKEMPKMQEAEEIAAIVGLEMLEFLLHEAVAELSNTMKP